MQNTFILNWLKLMFLIVKTSLKDGFVYRATVKLCLSAWLIRPRHTVLSQFRTTNIQPWSDITDVSSRNWTWLSWIRRQAPFPFSFWAGQVARNSKVKRRFSWIITTMIITLPRPYVYDDHLYHDGHNYHDEFHYHYYHKLLNRIRRKRCLIPHSFWKIYSLLSTTNK